MACLTSKFALNKSSGKISSEHILLPSDWLEFERFSFLLRANRLGLRGFFHSELLAHLICSEQIDWSLRGYLLLHNLLTPLDLLRARRVGFESFLFTDYSVNVYTVDTVKITSQIPLVLLRANQVGVRGYVSSQTPVDLLGAN